MASWAIDLGNSHTRVACWDSARGEPRLVELPEICRRPGGDEPLEAPRLVPSATHVLGDGDWTTRVGRWPVVRSLWFLGREALIGRQALEQNAAVVHPNFVPTFKPYLDREALRTLARCGKTHYTAREVARRFVRELLAEIRRVTGERLREVVLTTPVEAYETYRAELQGICGRVGIRRIRFIDEPVAAALGYGLSLARERLVLVVDFGGGTFHLALVGFEPGGAARGAAKVLAKEGRAVGGNLVNRWVLSEVCRRAGFDLEEEERDDDEFSFWLRLMLAEACHVKETVFFTPSTTFLLAPPAFRRGLARPGADRMKRIEFTREDLVAVLRYRGVYRMIEDGLENVLRPPGGDALSEKDIEEVLMVGGSTLLPEVYPILERGFGRDKVRAWQPFEAVAYGACAHGAEGARHSDFIVHDYAFVTYDPKTHEPQYNIIVPRGTRFPTASGFWKRQLVPTCSLGEPETLFKLVICEIGRPKEEARKFMWDQAGGLHQVGGDGGAQQLVVPLNESNPALGYLEPPHSPRDRRPRLEIAFGVNAERWLCATVYDLKRRMFLMKDSPVVRLL
jgi:molecular chaperone DnaK (HSP70)